MNMNKNDIIGIFRYAKVINVESNTRILVEDLETGKHFSVVGEEMIKEVFNATSFDHTSKVSLTQAEEILKLAGDKPLTVTFTKANGKQRTLSGIRVGDGNFGRSLVFDFGVNAIRQVDHRTISRLVLNGAEYLVK